MVVVVVLVLLSAMCVCFSFRCFEFLLLDDDNQIKFHNKNSTILPVPTRYCLQYVLLIDYNMCLIYNHLVCEWLQMVADANHP